MPLSVKQTKTLLGAKNDFLLQEVPGGWAILLKQVWTPADLQELGEAIATALQKTLTPQPTV